MYDAAALRPFRSGRSFTLGVLNCTCQVRSCMCTILHIEELHDFHTF